MAKMPDWSAYPSMSKNGAKITGNEWRAFGYKALKDLRSQYDPKQGGYKINGGTRGNDFLKSKYKPEQGGYYRDYYDLITSDPTILSRQRSGDHNPLVDHFRRQRNMFDPNYAWKSVIDYATEESIAKSRAKPYKQPSGTSQGIQGKRPLEKQLNFNNSTFLTKMRRLGGGLEDDTKLGRKTLLGA